MVPVARPEVVASPEVAEVLGVPETWGLICPEEGPLVGGAVPSARTEPVEICTDPSVAAGPVERTVSTFTVGIGSKVAPCEMPMRATGMQERDSANFMFGFIAALAEATSRRAVKHKIALLKN